MIIKTLDELINFVETSLKTSGQVKEVQVIGDLSLIVFAIDVKNRIASSTHIGTDVNETKALGICEHHIGQILDNDPTQKGLKSLN